MKTPVSVLDPLFEEPEDGTEVTAGMVRLSPEDADAITRTMPFERQRDADRTHIGMLADMFSNGEFAAGSQITFAIDDDGNPRLVDGQHRLRAAHQAKWSGLWNVRVVWSDKHRAAPVYTMLDSYQKKRPAAVIGRALGLTSLTDRMQGTAIAACSYQNQWRTEYSLPQGCKFPPVRDNITRVQERLPYFEQADDILGSGAVSNQAKRRIMASMVLAVMVETLANSSSGEGREFWLEVASHGGGVAGELRDNLLVGRPAKARQFYNPRLAGLAWNQRNSDKLKKDYQRVVSVEGTSLEVPV